MTKKLKVAFDVDDTLIIPCVVTGFDDDCPNYDTIAIYRWHQAQGHHMIVWSGGGVDYARRWAEKMGLDPDEVIAKEKLYTGTCAIGGYHEHGACEGCRVYVDIAYDDCEVDLGKVNVRVKRLKNGISRADWNVHGKTG